MPTQLRGFILILSLFSAALQNTYAADLRVAVASNFVVTAKALAPLFKQQTGYSVAISNASTGKLFAQIKNGAPFDVFLSADSTRPERLEQQDHTQPASRFTYALGKLVVWSTVLPQLSSDVLHDVGYRRLAIANPRHAPYGLASQQTLKNLGLWSAVQSKLLRAENVTQAFQFVATSNAELGFASLAQIEHLKKINLFKGSYWLVPKSLYSPIEQQAVMLRDSKAAQDFMVFMKSDEIQQLIRDHGYDTP